MAQTDREKEIAPSRDLQAMRRALIDLESGGQDFSRSKTLIQEALHQQGYNDLADKMANCKPSTKCHNPYCDACQKEIFHKQRKRFQAALSDPYAGDEASIREQVVFVTILHELIPFHMPETDIVRFPMTELQAALAHARKRLKSIRRSFDDEITFVGAFELEAVTGLLAQQHPVKGKVLAEMAGRDIKLSDRFLLFHSHFLVNLNGASRDKLKERLNMEWPENRQVVVDTLYQDVPVKESLRKLADYPFKFPIRYYLRFDKIYEAEEVSVGGKKHNVNRPLEPELIAGMVKATSEIGTNSLTIRMGTSKT